MKRGKKLLRQITKVRSSHASVSHQEVQELKQKLSELEKKNYDSEQMLEISKSFSSTLDLNALIESILYIAMAQMRVLGSGLFISRSYDSDCYSLSSNYSGLEVDPSADYCISHDSPLVEFFVSNPKPFTYSELKEALPDIKVEALDKIQPSLVVPLMLRKRVTGILVLGDKIILDEMEADYSDYEKEEILLIAGLASVAVHNASLVEQASCDLMTKLKLKYYFFNYLEDRLESSYAQDTNLSVIMFDIDFFKKFNDVYGHACGDYVLKTVASILQKSVREEDMASRYGGEEFTILLNNTGLDDALVVAERIRTSIESYDFCYEDQHMKVTISGGLSVFSLENNPVMSAKAIVDQADKALYVSKRNGRNQISVFKTETV